MRSQPILPGLPPPMSKTRRADNLAYYQSRRGKYPLEIWTVWELGPTLPKPEHLITVGEFCRIPFHDDNVIIWLFDTKSDYEKFKKRAGKLAIPKRQLT